MTWLSWKVFLENGTCLGILPNNLGILPKCLDFTKTIFSDIFPAPYKQLLYFYFFILPLTVSVGFFFQFVWRMMEAAQGEVVSGTRLYFPYHDKFDLRLSILAGLKTQSVRFGWKSTTAKVFQQRADDGHLVRLGGRAFAHCWGYARIIDMKRMYLHELSEDDVGREGAPAWVVNWRDFCKWYCPQFTDDEENIVIHRIHFICTQALQFGVPTRQMSKNKSSQVKVQFRQTSVAALRAKDAEITAFLGMVCTTEEEEQKRDYYMGVLMPYERIKLDQSKLLSDDITSQEHVASVLDRWVLHLQCYRSTQAPDNDTVISRLDARIEKMKVTSGDLKGRAVLFRAQFPKDLALPGKLHFPKIVAAADKDHGVSTYGPGPSFRATSSSSRDAASGARAFAGV
jgi:hypothetical protein